MCIEAIVHNYQYALEKAIKKIYRQQAKYGATDTDLITMAKFNTQMCALVQKHHSSLQYNNKWASNIRTQ